MRKISDKEWAGIKVLVEDLKAKRSAIDDAMTKMFAELKPQIEALDETLDNLRGVLEDLTQEASAYYESRSETWQEGEKGQAYSAWTEQISQAVDYCSLTLDLPEPQAVLEAVFDGIDAVAAYLEDDLQLQPDTE